MASHALVNAEILRQQKAARDGVQSWRRPAVFPVEPMLPASTAIPKTERTMAQVNAVLWLVNMARAHDGLAPVDHWGNLTGPEPPAVRVFGHLLAEIQRRRHERVGQLWMLMRHLDQHGSGRLLYDVIYRLGYTGQANMRRIIRDGVRAGYFWREGEHLAYRSEARVCAMLGIERINGWAVSIPVAQLLQPDIVRLRALFYDAFHSGRGDGFANPIARGGWRHGVGIKRATGRTRETQRTYESRRGIAVRANVEDLGPYSADDLERRHAEGHAVFVMRMKGGARIVERLSNAYRGTLRTVARGRRWLNHRIKAAMGGSGHLCKELRSNDGEIKRWYATRQHAAEARETIAGVRRYGWLRETPNGRSGLWVGVV